MNMKKYMRAGTEKKKKKTFIVSETETKLYYRVDVMAGRGRGRGKRECHVGRVAFWSGKVALAER